MANVTTSGTTSYPTALDTSTTLVDGSSGDEIIAENVNGPTAAVIAIETELGTLPKGTMSDLKTRLAVALNNDGTVKSSVIVGSAVSYLAGVFTVGSAAFDELGILQNGTFAATVGANALTFAAKTKAASDPTSTDFITVGFRNATAATGTYLARTITAALSVVVPSTATMGTVNAVAARIYWGYIDNAGTVEMCVWNPLTTTGLVGFSESDLQSTVAIAGGSNSAGVLYSTTARSNVPFRIGGYVEITEATAGTWATAPTILACMGPGVRKTGDVVQIRHTSSTAQANGSTVIPQDNTPPQLSEGDQYFIMAMTPTSVVNRLWHEANLMYTQTGGGLFNTACLFQAASSSATASTFLNTSGNANTAQSGSLHYEMQAATTASVTFAIRAGGTGSTFILNGIAGPASVFGNTAYSYYRITEIMT